MNKQMERHTGIPSCQIKKQKCFLQILHIYKHCRRDSLRAFPKGSLTLEASVVLPLFLCAVTALLYVFSFTCIQAEAYRRLVEKAELLAVTTGQNGTADPYVRLYDASVASLPFGNIFSGKKIAMQEVTVRAWVGYTGESFQKSDSQQVVYVTPEGTVCHRDRDCTHLRLSVQRLSWQALDTARNQSGGKYAPCEYCIKSTWTGTSVYITDHGTSYHSVNNCQGLKRTVMAVPWSQAAGRPLCSRCGGI